jgi:hypothetical protein
VAAGDAAPVAVVPARPNPTAEIAQADTPAANRCIMVVLMAVLSFIEHALFKRATATEEKRLPVEDVETPRYRERGCSLKAQVQVLLANSNTDVSVAVIRR